MATAKRNKHEMRPALEMALRRMSYADSWLKRYRDRLAELGDNMRARIEAECRALRSGA